MAGAILPGALNQRDSEPQPSRRPNEWFDSVAALPFSVRGCKKNLQKVPKTGLTRGARRHQAVQVRSKYFKKSEKKACQASKTSLILTAKPNQTNGETNDKIRTENV